MVAADSLIAAIASRTAAIADNRDGCVAVNRIAPGR